MTWPVRVLLCLQELESVIARLQLLVKFHAPLHDDLVWILGVECWFVTFFLIAVVPIVLPKIVSVRLDFTFSLHTRHFGIALSIYILRLALRYITCIPRKIKPRLTVWNSIKLMIFIILVFRKVARIAICWIVWPPVYIHSLSWFRNTGSDSFEFLHWGAFILRFGPIPSAMTVQIGRLRSRRYSRSLHVHWFSHL